MRSVIFRGKVASLIKRCGLSIHCQLHTTFVMLPIKNYKRASEFAEVVIGNIAIFLHLKYSKNGIFDDFIITSALHSDKAM